MAYRERIGGGAYRGGLEIVPVPRLAPEDPRSHRAAADRRVDSVAFQTDDGARSDRGGDPTDGSAEPRTEKNGWIEQGPARHRRFEMPLNQRDDQPRHDCCKPLPAPAAVPVRSPDRRGTPHRRFALGTPWWLHPIGESPRAASHGIRPRTCLLYTSDAADER